MGLWVYVLRRLKRIKDVHRVNAVQSCVCVGWGKGVGLPELCAEWMHGKRFGGLSLSGLGCITFRQVAPNLVIAQPALTYRLSWASELISNFTLFFIEGKSYSKIDTCWSLNINWKQSLTWLFDRKHKIVLFLWLAWVDASCWEVGCAILTAISAIPAALMEGFGLILKCEFSFLDKLIGTRTPPSSL